MERPRQHDGRVHGVIVGVRREDGRWLMIRRGPNVAAPLKVCFPGGAIEQGETRDAAALRELREEVGLRATYLRQVWYHESDDRPLVLWGYIGQVADFAATPCPNEVAELLWLKEHEIRRRTDLLGNTPLFLDALVQAAGEMAAAMEGITVDGSVGTGTNAAQTCDEVAFDSGSKTS